MVCRQLARLCRRFRLHRSDERLSAARASPDAVAERFPEVVVEERVDERVDGEADVRDLVDDRIGDEIVGERPRPDVDVDGEALRRDVAGDEDEYEEESDLQHALTARRRPLLETRTADLLVDARVEQSDDDERQQPEDDEVQQSERPVEQHVLLVRDDARQHEDDAVVLAVHQVLVLEQEDGAHRVGAGERPHADDVLAGPARAAAGRRARHDRPVAVVGDDDQRVHGGRLGGIDEELEGLAEGVAHRGGVARQHVGGQREQAAAEVGARQTHDVVVVAAVQPLRAVHERHHRRVGHDDADDAEHLDADGCRPEPLRQRL